MQELRVTFAGVQILFPLLLSLASTQRLGRLDDFDVAVYTVTLVSTALATMLPIARGPSTGWSSAGARRRHSCSSPIAC
jgi:hypothetical protein